MLDDATTYLNTKSKAKTQKLNNKQTMREGGLMTDEELQATHRKDKK